MFFHFCIFIRDSLVANADHVVGRGVCIDNVILQNNLRTMRTSLGFKRDIT